MRFMHIKFGRNQKGLVITPELKSLSLLDINFLRRVVEELATFVPNRYEGDSALFCDVPVGSWVRLWEKSLSQIGEKIEGGIATGNNNFRLCNFNRIVEVNLPNGGF